MDIFLKRTRGGGGSLEWPIRGGSAQKENLQVYKRVEIYWLKYIKGYENLSFRSVKRPEELTNAFYGCEKVKKKKNVPVL